MKNIKTKLLASTLAVITALTPVVSSAGALPDEKTTETNLLFLNLKSQGGSVVINDGEDTEHTIRLDKYEDTLCIDAYDKNDTLISSDDAEKNDYTYIYEAEKDSVVTIDAEADEGFEIASVTDENSEKDIFEKPSEEFSYPVFLNENKTLTFEFNKKESNIPETTPEVTPDITDTPDIPSDTEDEDNEMTNPTPSESPEFSDEIVINPEEEGNDKDNNEESTESGENNSDNESNDEDGRFDSQEEQASDVINDNEETISNNEEEPKDIPTVDTESIETDYMTEEITENGNNIGEEKEHFVEKEAGTESLNSADFASSRLLVIADSNDIIIDPEHLAGNYGNLYLLQYNSPEQSMNAYMYYSVHASAVEPDTVMTTASEEFSDVNAGDTTSPVEQENPINTLAEEIAGNNPVTGDKIIALIDTGVQEGPNVIDRVSLIEDTSLTGNGHGDKMVNAIVSVNENAKILAIKAMSNDGKGTVSAIVAGMEYAMKQDVDIINLSLYSKTNTINSVIDAEIQKALSLGIEVVGAAGNDGADVKDYMPGSVENAWIIGACDKDGIQSKSSNYGSTVDFNVVSDSTSEAAAKFSGFISKNGVQNIAINNGLIYDTNYMPEPNITPDVPSEDNTTDSTFGDEGELEQNIPTIEGFPSAHEVRYIDETVWIKDRWYDFKSYNPYGDKVTMTCESTFDSIDYQVNKTVSGSYVYTMKDNPDYVFGLEVTFTFTDDREVATVISDKALTLMPEFINQDRNDGYTGIVPEHVGDTVDGGKFYAVLGNKDFTLEGLLLPYNPDTFKVNKIVDNGNFDINKTGIYNVRYEMSYFMSFEHSWFLDIQVEVIDPEKLEPGYYLTSKESTLFLTRKSDGLYGGYGALFKLDEQNSEFKITCLDDEYEVGLVSSEETIITEDLYTLTDNGDKSRTLTFKLPEQKPEKAVILSTERPGYQSAKSFFGGGWKDQEYTEGEIEKLSDTGFEKYEAAVAGETNKNPDEYMSIAASWRNVYTPQYVSATATSGNANVTNYGWISSFPGANYGTVNAKNVASKIVSAVSRASSGKVTIEAKNVKNFSFACASGHNYMALPANTAHNCTITVQVQQYGTTDKYRVRLSTSFSRPSDGNGNYQSFYGSSYLSGESGLQLKITKRLKGRAFYQSTPLIGNLYTTFGIYTDKNCKNLEATVVLKDPSQAEEYSVATAVISLDPGYYWVKETHKIYGCVLNKEVYPIHLREGMKSPVDLKDALTEPVTNFPHLNPDAQYNAIYNKPHYFMGELFRKLTASYNDGGAPVAGAVFKVEYSNKKEDTGVAGDAFTQNLGSKDVHYTWYFKSDKDGKIIYDEAHYLASYTHPDTKKTYKSDPLIYYYKIPALPIGYLRAKEIYCPPQYVMNNNTFYFVLMPKLDNNGDPTIESLAISYGEYINGKFESNWAKKGGTSWTAEEPNIAAGKPGVNRAAIYNPIKNIQIGITKTSSTPQDVMELEGYSLKGATFEIWTAKEGGTKVTMYKDEANKQPVTQLVTDDKGKTPIYYIPVKSNATYWVREIVAPPGHKIHEPQSFTVTLPADAGKTKDVKFEDDPEWTKVPDAAVRKLNNSGRPIPGVVFKVCMYDGKYDTPSACPASKLKKTWYLKSGNDGKVTFDYQHLDADYDNDTFYLDANKKPVIPVNATLTMQEVKAPADCILDDTVMLWDTSGKVVEIKTHYNDKKPSSITIKKKDDDGQSPLSGVKFMLEFIKAKETPTADANPNPSYTPLLKEGESVTATTDSAGVIKWENLDEGEYKITEIETVPGHTLLPEPIKVTLPMVMTEQEVQQGNVDTSKGTFDDGYSNNWFFNDLTYEVTNSSTLDMPMTGAGGFWKYGFIGIGTMAAMVGGVVVYDMQKKRKRNKRRKK